MLPFATRGRGEPALVLMHYLGGSYREWTAVSDRLVDRFRCVGVDLPGFGEAALEVLGYGVAEMANAVAETVWSAELRRFVLVGHSMSAKVAAVLARLQMEGDPRLHGLEGLVLVAPSPPGPEPMSDRKRTQMLKSLGSEPGAGRSRDREKDREKEMARDRDAAEQYVRDNTDEDVEPAAFAFAVDDVLRMNRAAWRAWLEGGSKEDWAEGVGLLGLPVLLVAGDKDAALGPEVQRVVSMPHWPNGRLASLHSNHLIPLEKPTELARLMGEFAAALGEEEPVRPVPQREIEVDPEYAALIASDRVSEATGRVLEERARHDDPLRAPKVFTLTELTTLRALVDRVLPQRKPAIDIGARIDEALATGRGDGWRYAELPPDRQAWRDGLATLDWHARQREGQPFLVLDAARKDDLLAGAAAGSLDAGLLSRLEAAVGLATDRPLLSAAQMRLWFEDVRAEVTRIYVAHPATLAAMGYSGIADGGDTATAQGFVELGVAVVESWEPEGKGRREVRLPLVEAE